MRIKVVLESAEEGGYTVYVPSLPGCISEGDTFDGAMENIKEAFELYLEPDETVIPLMLPFWKVKELRRFNCHSNQRKTVNTAADWVE